MLAVSGPLRGPFRFALVPQATQADGLCALGLCQVKAVGLVQVVDLLVRYGKPPRAQKLLNLSLLKGLQHISDYLPNPNKKIMVK